MDIKNKAVYLLRVKVVTRRTGAVPGTKIRVMNTFTKDIETIANALTGRVEFSSIKFDQVLLSEEYRESNVNDIVFIKKAYGIYFYTRRSALDAITELRATKNMPVLVGCSESTNLYEISR